MIPSLLLPLLGVGEAAAGQGKTFWMPPQASTLAPDVDKVFYFIYWVDIAFFVLMMGAVIFFAIKYKQKKEGEKTSANKGSHSLELVWAVVPTILSVVMFVTGFRVYVESVIPPADSYDVRVVAQKWSWAFEYPSEGIEATELVVPADTNVRLTMNSKDVLHSFFVPDFRVKKDVVPGRYSVVWFNAPEPGEHHIFCTEYCGDGHSVMLNTVKVLPQDEYDAWLASQKAVAEAEGDLTGVALGESLFAKKACVGCHAIDGTKLVGPPMNGLLGRTEELADGSTIVADDDYIRESILAPTTKVVAGYAPSMPPFEGQLSETEINALIDYIKSLD